MLGQQLVAVATRDGGLDCVEEVAQVGGPRALRKDAEGARGDLGDGDALVGGADLGDEALHDGGIRLEATVEGDEAIAKPSGLERALGGGHGAPPHPREPSSGGADNLRFPSDLREKNAPMPKNRPGRLANLV